MSCLRSFVIGSSVIAAAIHLLIVGHSKISTIPMNEYAILAPFFFGLITMLSCYLGERFGWSLRERLWWVSLLSIAIVVAFSYFYSRYRYMPYMEFDQEDWVRYVIRNGLLHLFVYNVIIYNLELLFV